MGVTSRDITVSYKAHEIALNALFTLLGKSPKIQYKLYVDGDLVDEQTVSALFLPGTVTLRGQIPEDDPHPIPIRAEIKLKLVGRNVYEIFIGNQLLHRELQGLLSGLVSGV